MRVDSELHQPNIETSGQRETLHYNQLFRA
jgi:hypothetical protein